MGGQKYVPPIDKDREAIDQQKAAAEKSDRAWRTSQYFGSITGGGGSNHGLDWSSMPKAFIWR
jgi:hypothetical protein